ncbi:MAG: (2Fe-2S)-binding protein [Armatimonadetes bacterium]|nr:(2Fe-2S)-binding protein [Armatimonadota bacterium]
MSKLIELQINGRKYRINTDPERTLLSVLREDLHLNGSKYGCGEGQCGACTVLMDDKAIRSCITPVESVAGGRITTIEGLAKNGRLHPLQRAFLEADAMQCGYCTPGMIMSGVAFLSRNPDPDDREIIRFMEGNICRCGTYTRIVKAIHIAAKAMQEEGK